MPCKNLKKGGCVSDYGTVNGSYTLNPSASAATVGGAKRKPARKGGGVSDYATVTDSYTLNPTASSAKVGGCCGNNKYRKGGEPLNLPPAFDVFGSKFNQMVTNTNANTTTGGAKLRYRIGGNPLNLPPAFDVFGSKFNEMVTNTNANTGGGRINLKKGGVVVELAPMLTSLVLLGARAATDKSFKQSMSKGLGSILVSKPKSSMSKSSKSKSKS